MPGVTMFAEYLQLSPESMKLLAVLPLLLLFLHFLFFVFVGVAAQDWTLIKLGMAIGVFFMLFNLIPLESPRRDILVILCGVISYLFVAAGWLRFYKIRRPG